MPVSERRVRVVVYRVSQAEFEALVRASSLASARSLSDFSRSAVIAAAQQVENPESRGTDLRTWLDGINQELAELREQVLKLKQ